MNHKAKGTSAERELIHKFWATNTWTACRVAGSGGMRYPCPDIFAATTNRLLAIECKSTGDDRQYITKDQIEDLKTYAARSGAEAWIGVRFTGGAWYFFSLEDLKETPTLFGVTQKEAEQKGLSFNELVGVFEGEEKPILESECPE